MLDAFRHRGMLKDEDVAFDEHPQQAAPIVCETVILARRTEFGFPTLAGDESHLLETADGAVDAVAVGGDHPLAETRHLGGHLVGIGWLLVQEQEKPKSEQSLLVDTLPVFEQLIEISH